jgi:hypothetical protein
MACFVVKRPTVPLTAAIAYDQVTKRQKAWTICWISGYARFVVNERQATRSHRLTPSPVGLLGAIRLC